MKYILALVAFFTFTFFSHATSASSLNLNNNSNNCTTNCVEIVKLASGWHAMVKDSNGELWKVIPLELPEGAQKADHLNSGLEKISTRSASGVSTTTKTYETQTEVVVVYITEYRDSQGNLINVVVNTVRMKKATEIEP
ncbi:hypothetical protein [Idiomarina loihiensis]|uniref:hypothetical protein n=1 Tax=Idiomarina loihiensis TaxID=135577 RepID=UPI00384EDEB3